MFLSGIICVYKISLSSPTAAWTKYGLRCSGIQEQSKLAEWGQIRTKFLHGTELLDLGLSTGLDEDKIGIFPWWDVWKWDTGTPGAVC